MEYDSPAKLLERADSLFSKLIREYSFEISHFLQLHKIKVVVKLVNICRNYTLFMLSTTLLLSIDRFYDCLLIMFSINVE